MATNQDKAKTSDQKEVDPGPASSKVNKGDDRAIWYVPGPFYQYKEDVKELAREKGLIIIDANQTEDRTNRAVNVPVLSLKPEYDHANDATANKAARDAVIDQTAKDEKKAADDADRDAKMAAENEDRIKDSASYMIPAEDRPASARGAIPGTVSEKAQQAKDGKSTANDPSGVEPPAADKAAADKAASAPPVVKKGA